MGLHIPVHLVNQIKAVLNEVSASKVHAILNALDDPTLCKVVGEVGADAALVAPLAQAIPGAAAVAAVANEVAAVAQSAPAAASPEAGVAQP